MSEKTKDDQVSTKEFLLNAFSYFNFLGKNWSLLLAALVLGTIYDSINSIYLNPGDTYSGQTTFHLELEGGGTQNQLGGFASAFGLTTGGGGQGGSILAASNFQSIILSVNVFQNAFMKEVKIGNKKDLFINYFIDSSDIKKKEWAGSLINPVSPFASYKFKKKSVREFTPYENQIISEVFTKLYTATQVEPEEGTSLIAVYATTSNEKLTKAWIEILLEATEDFYKEMKTKKTRQILKVQESRLDSLAYALKYNDKRIARLTFDNPNVVDPSGLMRQQQVTRDNTYLSNQYYTQLANVEGLNRLIIEQTPIFTILEPVRLPLSVIKKTGFSTRLGGLISLVLMIFIISIRKTYLDIMSSKSN